MKILAIDTSCDETAAAVTDNTKVLSNIIWSQASLHAKWGGVLPSLAQRMHQERIDFVVEKSLTQARCKISDIDSIAVTTGPGLSIALAVGVKKAKELSKKYNKPLIAVNHVEAHLLSPFANAKTKTKFPAYGLCVSGKNTIFVLIEKIGKYKILAQTTDDALGEALDKGARLLGLGYPGGAIFEKFARLGKNNSYSLPVPLISDKIKNRFSYSGLKSAFVRLVSQIKDLSRNEIYNLASVYQDVSFKHIENVLSYQIMHSPTKTGKLLLGGGVGANVELRKRLRGLGRKCGFKLHTPYSSKLYGDNAAMIGITAYLNPKTVDPNKIDQDPKAKISA
jgi:N6-L-threonylcarbamoyladenine synthase